MRYLALFIPLILSQSVSAQSWYDEMLSDLYDCREQAWQDCPDTLACLEQRAAAKAACRAQCEYTLATRSTNAFTRNLRADELACLLTDHQDLGLVCEDRQAWRRSEIAARQDAFDYALHEYPYLARLTASEIVDKIFRVAELGFKAEGTCVTTSQGRSVTLLYTTALAINRVRAVGPGAHRWEQAQALSLRWLRARRGY